MREEFQIQDWGINNNYNDEIPLDYHSKVVKIYEKSKIKIDISLNCSNYWMQIFDQTFLKITDIKKVNGPQNGSFLDKGIIEFVPIKKGELNLSIIEINHLGPYKKIIYNIKII